MDTQKSNELLKNFNAKTLTFVDDGAAGRRTAYQNFLLQWAKNQKNIISRLQEHMYILRP